MDIINLSMAMSSFKTQNELSMRVMKMALDQTKEVGELLSGMEEAIASADLSVGQLLDISI